MGFQRYKEDYKGLQGILTVYRGLQGFTGGSTELQGLKEYLTVYWGLPGITGDYNG